MAYFDFSNTPIESDITLKARWCCGAQPPAMWDDPSGLEGRISR